MVDSQWLLGYNDTMQITLHQFSGNIAGIIRSRMITDSIKLSICHTLLTCMALTSWEPWMQISVHSEMGVLHPEEFRA